MNVLYTARTIFDKKSNAGTLGWEKYIEWSRLYQLSELVSLDGMLNELLVEPERSDEKEWSYIVVEDGYETGLFTSLDYVLEKVRGKGAFNLLTTVKEPDIDGGKFYVFRSV